MLKRRMKTNIFIFLSVSVLLSGCSLIESKVDQMNSALHGRNSIIQSYDEESNIIDRIEGSSIEVGPEDMFATTDSDGDTIKNSSVLSITVGGKPMMHVGSSLILAEKGLTNVFEEFAKTADVKNTDRSLPFVNQMVNSVKNLTTGKKLLILIRSQSGKPLATYTGNHVSYFATDIDKSTGLLIDGMYLLIYRCDYTIYGLSLLSNG